MYIFYIRQAPRCARSRTGTPPRSLGGEIPMMLYIYIYIYIQILHNNIYVYTHIYIYIYIYTQILYRERLGARTRITGVCEQTIFLYSSLCSAVLEDFFFNSHRYHLQLSPDPWGGIPGLFLTPEIHSTHLDFRAPKSKMTARLGLLVNDSPSPSMANISMSAQQSIKNTHTHLATRPIFKRRSC